MRLRQRRSSSAASLQAVQLAQPDPASQLSLRSPPSAWDTYKVRLADPGAQQGVREATIQANVPGLTVNQRVIELERTEPVARTSGGVVGSLAPYLRATSPPR